MLLSPLSSRDHEPGPFEHREVLGHAEARELGDRLQFALGGAVVFEEMVEQEAAGGVGECLEDVVVVLPPWFVIAARIRD